MEFPTFTYESNHSYSSIKTTDAYGLEKHEDCLAVNSQVSLVTKTTRSIFFEKYASIDLHKSIINRTFEVKEHD